MQVRGELALDLELGRTAATLDAGARRVTLDDGRAIEYDGLVIATGASPRMLPGAAPLEGLHVLRTLDDSLRLRAALANSFERRCAS